MSRAYKDFLPSWVLPRRPMTADDVASATGYSAFFIHDLRKSGQLRPMLGKRPYRFDSVHVFDTLFRAEGEVNPPAKPQGKSSLKTESESLRDLKPVKGKDLWS